MGYAIFRAEKRQHAGAVAMSLHALRDGAAVPNAVPGAPAPEVLAGAKSTRDLVKRLNTLIGAAKAAGQRWRDNNVAAVDMLFTYTNGSINSKSEQDVYFNRCLEWLRSTWPTAEILTAAVHRDETTPHLQLLMAPLDAKAHFNAKALLGGPGMFRAHQDSFWLSCGQPHGLARGEKGSKAKHIPVQTFYAHAAGVIADNSIEIETVPELVEQNWKTVTSGEYKASKDKREEVIKRNNSKTSELIKQSRQLRSLHPAIIARESEKYRENIRLTALYKADKEQAEKARNEAEKLAQKAAHDMREVQLQAQAADNLWTKSGAQMLDRWSRAMAPEMVARVARQLGIELVAGKPLLDQMRRQGRGRTLLECATLLDKQIDGALLPHVQQQLLEQQRERERGG